MLKGKVCLVTGANRGIGFAIAKEYAKNGAIVYANARKENSLDLLMDECVNEYSQRIIPLYFDVTDEKKIRECMTRIKKEQGRLDVLVNNAGIMKDSVLGMINNDLMQEVFDVNVFSVINLIQYACKIMIRQKSGSIINMTSIVGTNGSPGQVVYSASKGAVISMTKAVAKEVAQHGIRVNAIAPGMIDTDLLKSIGEDNLSKSLERIGMKHFGMPKDVANTAVYLASDLSEYVTGQVIGVDGSAIL